MDTTAQSRAADATQYLVDSASVIAKAKADLVRAECMLRVVKCQVMKSCGQTSVSAQEREAYASPEYLKAIEDLASASEGHEYHRAGREAAKGKIEFWRSLNANQRAAERGFGS